MNHKPIVYVTVGSNSNVAERGLAAEQGRAAILPWSKVKFPKPIPLWCGFTANV